MALTSGIAQCNEAFSLLGASTITSFEDGTDLSALASRLYLSTLDEVLEAGQWSFARVRQALVEIADSDGDAVAPAYGYDHQYALPTDPYCLHIMDTNLDQADAYEVETYISSDGATRTRVLLTDATSISIRYIARLSDPAYWTPLFASALTLCLTWKSCYAITKNATLVEFYERKYAAVMATAKSRGGQEGRAKKAWLSETLTNVRF